MEWHFAIPGGAGNSCRLEKSFWLGRVKLHYRGRAVTRSKEAGKPFLMPLLLMFVGGALGGLAGGAGAVFNYRLLRTDADTAVKTAGIFGITLASAVVYLVLAVFAHALFGR
jgi:hypothetical protein